LSARLDTGFSRALYRCARRPARIVHPGCFMSARRARDALQGDSFFERGTSVNKNDLIDAIARHADISKAAAGRALDATMDSISTSLARGDMVTLVGFGSFYVGKRTARSGRNPRTGAAIRIGAAKVPKFRAGKALKDALN
jgi:DNA-binding protein HU-beta